LQDEALRAFEARVTADKALAAEMAFQREMQAFLADTPENELRKTLQIYYQIYAGSQTFTGKYVILPVGSR